MLTSPVHGQLTKARLAAIVMKETRDPAYIHTYIHTVQAAIPTSPVHGQLTKAQLIAIVMRGTRDPATRAPLIHMINSEVIWTKAQLSEKGVLNMCVNLHIYL
jgi:hypothetical protein